MDVVVVRILFGQLLSEFEHFVGLAGLLQVVRTLLHPVLHGFHVVRLLLVDRLHQVEQFERLVGLENAGRLAEEAGRQEVVRHTRLGQAGCLVQNSSSQLLAAPALVQHGVANPTHAAFAFGQRFSRIKVFENSLPILDAGKVNGQCHSVIERCFFISNRLFRIFHLGHRLAEQLNALAVAQLSGYAVVEGVLVQFGELQCLPRSSFAVLIERFDPRGPPRAGNLNEIVVPCRRGRLVVLAILETQNDMAFGVYQDVRLVGGRSGVFQHEERACIALPFQADRVSRIRALERLRQVAAQSGGRMAKVCGCGLAEASKKQIRGEDAPLVLIAPLDRSLRSNRAGTNQPGIRRNESQCLGTPRQFVPPRIE